MQLFDNGSHVKDAAGPGAAAGVLQGGPKSRVGRQMRIRGQIGPRLPPCQHASAFFRSKDFVTRADQVHTAFQLISVDDDLNAVYQYLIGSNGGQG